MPASLLIDEPVAASDPPDHRRLRYCMAISTLVVAGVLMVLDWPTFDPGRALRIVVDLLPRQRSREEPQPLEDERIPQPAAPADPADEPIAPPVPRAEQTETAQADERAAPADAVDESPAEAQATRADTVEEPQVEAQAPPVITGADSPTGEQARDWQEAKERASAEVIREMNEEVVSMHPELEELRRIARERYAPPRTGKPPPIWENVEPDIYGRTLLWFNDYCYKVLEDTNVGNRYAFETFEKHMTFCAITLGKGPGGKNLPWVEEIVARYPYLRYPDGEIPPAEDQ